MSDGGKGSAPRPYSVSRKEFADNWEKAFSKRKTNEDGEVLLGEPLKEDKEKVSED